MTPRSSSKPTHPRPYHHGNLRRALLEAGLQLLREGGTEAITLRTVARRAGVSHAAPYHHFGDKAALIEALAVEAFGRFTGMLSETWVTTGGTTLERLGALGVAYVSFAVEHAAEFRLINRPELRQAPHPGKSAIKVAAQECYDVLRKAVVACQEDGLVAPGDPESLALTAWSVVHGLAVLFIDGLLDGQHDSLGEGITLARTVTRTLGLGLLIRTDA